MNKHCILNLYSRTSLNTMSKSKKKLYKLLLTALSTNLFTGNILNEDTKSIIYDLNTLLEETYCSELYDERYIQYREFLKKQISDDKIWKLHDEDSYNELITLTRKILEELTEKNVSVYKREVIEKYVDIMTLIKNIDNNVKWIGINFETGLYPYIPEKLTWFDFKVIWNMFAKYKKDDINNWIDSVDYNMQYERVFNKNSIETQLLAGTLERSVLILCITFIESFLYNTRIVIRDNPIFINRIENYNLNNIIHNEKIIDIQIIEDILFKLYPKLKESIISNYQVYKELLKIRDKYIHISVRENADHQPEMASLLYSSGLNIEMKLKYVLDMIDKINDYIMDKEGINLLWWREKDVCDFINYKLFRLIP